MHVQAQLDLGSSGLYKVLNLKDRSAWALSMCTVLKHHLHQKADMKEKKTSEKIGMKAEMIAQF